MHRILLVEDSPDLAFGLQRNLEMDGHEVSVATKASQAWRSPRPSGPT
jgi:DNA-binding response OmpR family regulator